jgi:hypothetical protein
MRVKLLSKKECFPKCQSFRCTQRALSFRGKTAWCGFTNEECNIAKCNYAVCRKNQLLYNGVCGLSVKRKTRDTSRPEDFLKDEIIARGKLARKIGEKKIF